MSDLVAGYRVLPAPNFPPLTDWSSRLKLSSGVEIEGEHATPRLPWREPTPDEFALLLRDPDAPLTQADLDSNLALMTLPRHLVARWWDLLAQASPTGGLVGFDTYLRQVYDFLIFKNLLAATDSLAAEVVACPPGRSSLRTDPVTNEPAGLGWSVSPDFRLWGLFNLGEEASTLVYVNRSVDLDSDPTYPVVGIRLEPGEGCRLPVAGVLLDTRTGPTVPDLWLLLRTA